MLLIKLQQFSFVNGNILCFANNINFVVQSGIYEIQYIVSEMKGTVKQFKKGSHVLVQLHNCWVQMNFLTLKLKDVPSCWNSMYMIKQAWDNKAPRVSTLASPGLLEFTLSQKMVYH
jgi:hypothetical protein